PWAAPGFGGGPRIASDNIRNAGTTTPPARNAPRPGGPPGWMPEPAPPGSPQPDFFFWPRRRAFGYPLTTGRGTSDAHRGAGGAGGDVVAVPGGPAAVPRKRLPRRAGTGGRCRTGGVIMA